MGTVWVSCSRKTEFSPKVLTWDLSWSGEIESIDSERFSVTGKVGVLQELWVCNVVPCAPRPFSILILLERRYLSHRQLSNIVEG